LADRSLEQPTVIDKADRGAQEFNQRGVAMRELEQLVSAARWRLNFALFLSLCTRTLAIGLALVSVAWLAPKIWSLNSWLPGVEVPAWYWGTLSIGLLLGLIWAALQLWRRRPSPLDAAVEIDQRFALRERLSSAWALDPATADSAAGQALLADAAERAARIDIRDQFPIRLERRAAWLLVPIAAIAILALLPDAETTQPVAITPVVNEQKPIEVAVEVAKKSLEEKAKQLEEQGLKDAAAELETLARKSELGNVETLKENLAKLKQAGEGTADKLTQALAESDFEQARELVKELARKLKAGELSEQERQRLSADLKKLAAAADQLVKEHEQAKRDLEAQIRQAQAEGNLQKAADLQRKLEQREAVERQMEQLRKAAENLQRAGDAVQPQAKPGQQQSGEQENNQAQPKAGGQQKPSNAPASPGQSEKSAEQNKNAGEGEEGLKQAQQALEDLAEQMEQMESDEAMQEQLQDLEQELQDCKDGINGCKNPGDAPGESRKRSRSDFAAGAGIGQGQRELEENETGDYRSKVKGRLQKGETVTTGDADGPNLPGGSAAEARELIKSELSRQNDPLEDQQLPRAQREQAKEYFQRLRGGKE
jgi:hypothetical protein